MIVLFLLCKYFDNLKIKDDEANIIIQELLNKIQFDISPFALRIRKIIFDYFYNLETENGIVAIMINSINLSDLPKLLKVLNKSFDELIKYDITYRVWHNNSERDYSMEELEKIYSNLVDK